MLEGDTLYFRVLSQVYTLMHQEQKYNIEI